jgi:hypothetical protein
MSTNEENEPTKESLARYRERVGPDDYTFRAGDSRESSSYKSATMIHATPSRCFMMRATSSWLRTTGTRTGMRARDTFSMGPIPRRSTSRYRNKSALSA